MTLALVFDGILAALLVATIAYAVLLNRKLSVLREARDEMAGLADRFAAATAKAGSGLVEMRGLAEESGELLERRIARAQGVRDELAFLLESAAGIAKRLERGRASAGKGAGKGAMEVPNGSERGAESAPQDDERGETSPRKRAPGRRTRGDVSRPAGAVRGAAGHALNDECDDPRVRHISCVRLWDTNRSRVNELTFF